MTNSPDLSALAAPASFPRLVAATPDIIVVALGGNALSPAGERVTIHDQFRHTRTSLGVVVELIADGWGVVIVHGNGPQVGQALTRNELAGDVVEPLPLGVLVASTAGWIGYMIQQCLQNALAKSGMDKTVLTLITQTVVRADDPALADPSKPVGNVLSPERIERLRANGVSVGTDARGRTRRLAPSPEPIEVVEAGAVRHLVDVGAVAIAAGGGGPPVTRGDPGTCEGLDAVVDKDLTAAVLGRAVRASNLLILTDVDAVYRYWGTEQAVPLRRLSVAEARDMVASGQVSAGSMGPKLSAAIHFIDAGGERAVIAHLGEGTSALRGASGTTITGD